jgi:hypothetical protein
MNRIQNILIIGLLILNQNVFGQDYIDSLINELRRPNFYPSMGQSKNVNKSKDTLVNLGEKAIPKLIELLKDTSFVKLTNTNGLIYPGATKYYGHGGIIDYDIDWISVRAGWVLEEITFEDFGYKQNRITEDELFKLRETNYESEYLKKGTYKVNFKDSTDNEILKQYRIQLAIKVEKWWGANHNNWTRFKAIKDALESDNSNRQYDALCYLNFGESKCPGLTKESFENELKPLVKKIRRNGKDGADEQAKELLRDKEFYWLTIKR